MKEEEGQPKKLTAKVKMYKRRSFGFSFLGVAFSFLFPSTESDA